MKTQKAKEAPLQRPSGSVGDSHPGLMNELKKAQKSYEETRGPEKEKVQADLQMLSNEKRRLTGDANPPAPGS